MKIHHKYFMDKEKEDPYKDYMKDSYYDNYCK